MPSTALLAASDAPATNAQITENTTHSSILAHFRSLGVGLRLSWLLHYLAVRPLPPSFAVDSPASAPFVEQLFATYLFQNFYIVNEPVLPPNAHTLHNTSLHGQYLLQFVQCVGVHESRQSGQGNDKKNNENKEGCASGVLPGGANRLLKLALTDGHHVLICLEYPKRIHFLHGILDAGVKFLVRDVKMRHGYALINENNIRLAGGKVDGLSEYMEARRRSSSNNNIPLRAGAQREANGPNTENNENHAPHISTPPSQPAPAVAPAPPAVIPPAFNFPSAPFSSPVSSRLSLKKRPMQDESNIQTNIQQQQQQHMSIDRADAHIPPEMSSRSSSSSAAPAAQAHGHTQAPKATTATAATAAVGARSRVKEEYVFDFTDEPSQQPLKDEDDEEIKEIARPSARVAKAPRTASDSAHQRGASPPAQSARQASPTMQAVNSNPSPSSSSSPTSAPAPAAAPVPVPASASAPAPANAPSNPPSTPSSPHSVSFIDLCDSMADPFADIGDPHDLPLFDRQSLDEECLSQQEQIQRMDYERQQRQRADQEGEEEAWRQQEAAMKEAGHWVKAEPMQAGDKQENIHSESTQPKQSSPTRLPESAAAMADDDSKNAALTPSTPSASFTSSSSSSSSSSSFTSLVTASPVRVVLFDPASFDVILRIADGAREMDVRLMPLFMMKRLFNVASIEEYRGLSDDEQKRRLDLVGIKLSEMNGVYKIRWPDRSEDANGVRIKKEKIKDRDDADGGGPVGDGAAAAEAEQEQGDELDDYPLVIDFTYKAPKGFTIHG